MTGGADRRVSVIVPCYNRAAYLDVLLRSITWSSVPRDELEVVIVNDGGADHVRLVADAWRREGLDIHLCELAAHHAPRNNAVARNAGLRRARYPIIVQTDPEMVFASDVLSRIRSVLEPGTFCSSSACYPLTRDDTLDLVFGTRGAQTAAPAYLERARGRPNLVLSPGGSHGLHAAFGCLKDDLLRIGGYDESFRHWGWEDCELLVTLARDGGLVRRYVEGTPVVHLWHPPARGETGREDLASLGELSRCAWEVQMQRASAAYPRSERPRCQPRREDGASTPRTFTLDAYRDWVSQDTSARHQRALALLAAGDAHEARRTRPLAFQLFFDAHRFEAIQLRAAGHTSLARGLLHYTLRRPWERARRSDDWRAYQSAPESVDEWLGVELQLYEHVDDALAELAACEDALGHPRVRDEILDALTDVFGRGAAASAARARSALMLGNLEAAARHAEGLHGAAWTGLTAALGIEIALLTGHPARASQIFVESFAEGHVDHDYFDRLRLASYGRLIAELTPVPLRGARLDGIPAGESDDRSELLYSSAIRSVRGGLDIAACLLLGRFLQGDARAEARLYEEGRAHLAEARERIGRVAPERAREMFDGREATLANGPGR